MKIDICNTHPSRGRDNHLKTLIIGIEIVKGNQEVLESGGLFQFLDQIATLTGFLFYIFYFCFAWSLSYTTFPIRPQGLLV
uniref:Uncharacterized protein n=1 Tax=Utricularia reniformis TaxID=192314 RepID=A0A1Y0B254_9LAMI|nr:hypothetical protein AEK19_MT1337 [Utricularia reniformis]ART31535.1 hypothetical protein AEK19_MT1337 [Utricularia reniformis]